MTAGDATREPPPSAADPELARLLPVGVFAVDRSARCVSVSDRWCELSGIPAAAAQGRPWLDLVDPRDGAGVDAAWQQLVDGGEPLDLELRLVDPDGETRPVRVRLAAHRDDHGGFAGAVGTIGEVVDRRARVAALANVMDRSTDMVVVLDEAGIIRWANQATERVLGHDRRAKYGTPVVDLVHPDDVDRCRAGLAATLRADEPLPPAHVRVRGADGSWRHVEATSTNLLDDPGIRGIALTARDVTERHELERRVHELEHNFASAFRHSPVGRALVDLDGRWLQVNEACAALLGSTPAALIGQPGIDAVHPDDRARVRDEILRLVRREVEELTIETRFQRAAGDTVWGRFSVWYVRDDDGRPLYYGTDITDITELRAAQELQERTRRHFEALVERSSDIVTVLERDGTWRSSSAAGVRILGWEKGYNPEGGIFSLIHPDDVGTALDALASLQADPSSPREPLVLRIRARDGTYRYFETVGQDLSDDPAVGGVVLNSRDVTERRSAEQRANELVEVLEATNELVVMSDPAGAIVYANRSARALLGARERQHVSALSSARSRERLRAEIMPQVRSRGAWSGELELVDPTGHLIPVAATIQTHRDDTDAIVRVATVAHDITDLKAQQRRLEFEATHDALTGLPNRALFREIGERALAVATRTRDPLAVLFLDLDAFKLVNDSFGHDAGDVLLGLVAQRLREAVRAGDVVARLGGDEFVILCERARSEHQMLDLSNRIIETVSQPFTIDDHEVRVGLSIGVALSRDAAASIAELIRDADIALYEAKNAGRGRACLYEPSIAGG